LKIYVKLESCHFDTTEVMEAESQAMLNSLTEQDFQDAFKNGRSAGISAWGWWWEVCPKLVFYQMAAPVPEIMGTPHFTFPCQYCHTLIVFQVRVRRM
jgi:hypothetical protein